MKKKALLIGTALLLSSSLQANKVEKPFATKGMGHKMMNKKVKHSPFLITSSELPHMTKTIKQNWDSSDLALSSEQKDKLLVVRMETIGAIKNIKQQLMPLQVEIIDAMKSKKDPKTLQVQLEKIAKLKLEASNAHLNCIYNTSNILSKEQLLYLYPSRK